MGPKISDDLLEWFRDHPEVMGHTADVIVSQARRYQRYGGDHSPTTDEGVYFLMDAGEIVYVGKTESINARLGDHWRSKKFDSYWCFCGVPYEWLEYIENFYIRRLRPRLNGRHPFNSPRDLEAITDQLEAIARALS